jgi:hypothetical protein
MSSPSTSALGVAARSLAPVAYAYTGAHIPVFVVRSLLFDMLGYVTETLPQPLFAPHQHADGCSAFYLT